MLGLRSVIILIVLAVSRMPAFSMPVKLAKLKHLSEKSHAQTQWASTHFYWYPQSRDKAGFGAYQTPSVGNPIIPLTKRCADKLTAIINQLNLQGGDRQKMVGVTFWGAGATDCTWAMSSQPTGDAGAVDATFCQYKATTNGDVPNGAQQVDNPLGVCAAAKLIKDAKTRAQSVQCMAERKPVDGGSHSESCGTCQATLGSQIALMYANGVPAADPAEGRYWENDVIARVQALVTEHKTSRKQLQARSRHAESHPAALSQTEKNKLTNFLTEVTQLTDAKQRCDAYVVGAPACTVPTDTENE